MESTGHLALSGSAVASVLGAALICWLVIRYGFTRDADPAGRWGWRPTRFGHGLAAVLFGTAVVLALLALTADPLGGWERYRRFADRLAERVEALRTRVSAFDSATASLARREPPRSAPPGASPAVTSPERAGPERSTTGPSQAALSASPRPAPPHEEPVLGPPRPTPRESAVTPAADAGAPRAARTSRHRQTANAVADRTSSAAEPRAMPRNDTAPGTPAARARTKHHLDAPGARTPAAREDHRDERRAATDIAKDVPAGRDEARRARRDQHDRSGAPGGPPERSEATDSARADRRGDHDLTPGITGVVGVERRGARTVTRSGPEGSLEGPTRGDGMGRPELADRTDRAERIERVGRVERPDRSERAVRPERVERSERAERPERIEKVERMERVERPERIERVERLERVERPERVERVERVERPARVERVERVERRGR